MNKVEEVYYLAGLATCSGLKPIQTQEILSLFENSFNVWQATQIELKKLHVPDPIIQKIIEWQKTFKPSEFKKNIDSLGIRIVSYLDKEYPQLLKEIPDFPQILYLRGQLSSDDYCFAVVGNRRISPYGFRMTERISQKLVEAGLVIVSGLALGVDSVAHKTAVGSDQKTIAVLAHGLDRIYPSSHRGLAQEILAKGGAIVSEYPPGILPLKHHFLERNRIIAGMSVATLVTEAGERSGALTTARLANEYNRVVYAVPGDAEREQALGVNNLIKQGATPITKGEEILQDLNIDFSVEEKAIKLEGLAEDIYNTLSLEPMHIDVLAISLNITSSQLSSVLMELELRNIVKNVGGMKFIRNG